MCGFVKMIATALYNYNDDDYGDDNNNSNKEHSKCRTGNMSIS